jgi:hypothetical protein
MQHQPTELEKIGPLYARLMEEIKRRTEVIREVLNNTITMPEMAAFEFCYLQLRKICEVFALACLSARTRRLTTPSAPGCSANTENRCRNRLE